MANEIQSSLGNVFSIMPQSNAQHALEVLVDAYLEHDGEFSSNIKWAEFRLNGAFVRGGVSTFDQNHTELLTAANTDVDIIQMTALAKQGRLRAGDSHYNPQTNAMYWFVPTGSYTQGGTGQDSRGLKGLCVREALFADILDLFNAPVVLTAAEKRVVFQLTAGLSLREAALAQDVSIETKRAQLKSACSKLQCGGQNDLIRLSLGQVSHLLMATNTESRQSDNLEEFVNQYLPGIAQLNVVTLENGRSMRYLLMGPDDGKPLVLVHGMLFPLMLLKAPQYLKEHGIRLYVPIRNGYLQPQIMAELMKESVGAVEFIDNLALFIKRTFDEPVPVLAQSFGCHFALQFCRQHQSLVSRVFMLSMNCAASSNKTSNYNRRFLDGLRELYRHPGLFRYVTWQFRKYYVNDRQATKTLNKMFSENDCDRGVLNQTYNDQPSCAWFSSMFKQSVVGIADDMSVAMTPWHEQLDALVQPVYWLHGSRDCFSDATSVRQTVVQRGHAFEEVKDGGHLIYASHAKTVWSRVATFIQHQSGRIAISPSN